MAADYSKCDIALEIQNLKARYFRHMDTQNFAEMDKVFADDAIIDVMGSISDDSNQSPVEGFDEAGVMSGIAFRQFVRKTLKGMTTVHHGHMGEIEVLNARQAKAVWAMEDLVWFPPDQPYSLMQGWGHYHETYTCQPDGHWVIQTMKLTRLKVILHKSGAEPVPILS